MVPRYMEKTGIKIQLSNRRREAILNERAESNRTESPNQLQATLTIEIENENFNINVPLSYKKLDPVRGDVVEQLRVVPDKSIDFSSNLIIANTDGSLKTSVRIHPFKPLENIGLMLLFNDKLLTTYSNLNFMTNISPFRMKRLPIV